MNYKIEQLERDTTGGVRVVHWVVTKTQGEHNAYACGTCGFQPNPNSDDFVEFESLTEAQVITWVQGQIDTAKIEQRLDDILAEKATPQILTGLPDNWSTT